MLGGTLQLSAATFVEDVVHTPMQLLRKFKGDPLGEEACGHFGFRSPLDDYLGQVGNETTALVQMP